MEQSTSAFEPQNGETVVAVRHDTEGTSVDETPESMESSSLHDVELGDQAEPQHYDMGKKRGWHLRWSRLHKTVEVRENNSGLLRSSIAAPTADSDASYKKSGSTKKVILNEVSGYAAPGELLALMGPSGSGKTSLLNALSGRSVFESGTLSINGEPATKHSMKRLMSKIAYVKQNDVFFGYLTVRDQLTYTALLRLPSDMRKSQKHAEVDRIIRMLRLKKVADSPINRLSGGEKKRVNIGTELLTDPSIIMLDEPTSGLDSTSAVALLRMLLDLAGKHGKTVVTSIHQPSSAVFRSFDRLMMLADGNVVYFGTPTGSMSYLRDCGLPCPDGYNAADHWMDLLVVDSAIEQEQEEEEEDSLGHTMTEEGINETQHTIDNTSHTKLDYSSSNEDIDSTIRRRGSAGKLRKERVQSNKRKGSPKQLLIDAWDSERVAAQVDDAVESVAGGGNTSSADSVHNSTADDMKKYNSSWMTQYRVLTHRSMKNSRSAIFTPLNIIQSFLIGLVTGLLWFQVSYTERNVADISSYYFFTMTYWVFHSMFNALTTFPSEREVMFKERASGSYHLSAYFMAKTTSEAPTRLLLPFFYMIISYWMAGLNNSFVIFLGSTFCTLLSVMAGESVGLLIGASVFDFERSLVVMTVFALTLMLTGGYFVENMPVFVSWMKFLSPFKYAFDASRQLVFDRNVPCDGSGALETICQGEDTGFATPEEVIEFIGVQGSVGFNVGMLIVMFLVPRFGAYLALKRKKGGERS